MIDERWVMFEPLGTITVRDGRRFDGGQQSAARTVLPSPATVVGVIGAAYQARPDEELRAEARGQCRPVPAGRSVRGHRWGPPGVVDERRVGLALGEDGTAAEGMLYSTEHLRPTDGVDFVVRCLQEPEKALVGSVPVSWCRGSSSRAVARLNWFRDEEQSWV